MASHKSKSRSVVVLRPSMRNSVRRHSSRRQSISRGFGFAKGIVGTVRRYTSPYAEALGTGTIIVGVASKVKPDLTMSQAQMAGLIGEYIGGGVKGAIGAEAIKALLGVPSIFTNFSLGNLFGGGGSSNNNSMMQSGGNALL